MLNEKISTWFPAQLEERKYLRQQTLNNIYRFTYLDYSLRQQT